MHTCSHISAAATIKLLDIYERRMQEQPFSFDAGIIQFTQLMLRCFQIILLTITNYIQHEAEDQSNYLVLSAYCPTWKFASLL